MLTGCDPRARNVEVTPNAEIVTVATLRFETTVPVRTRAVFGDGDVELATSLEAEPTEQHEIRLVGAPAAATVGVRIETEAGDVVGETTFETGILPNLVSDVAASGEMDGWMVTTLLGEISGPVVLAPDGRIAWYHVDESGFDVFRALPSADGTGVWYNTSDISTEAPQDGALVHVGWDGEIGASVTVPLLAQDFVELPGGTLVADALEVRDDGSGGEIRGSQLVEADRDGVIGTVWSAWDCFDPAVDTSNDPALGWIWVNALDHLADTDQLVVSARNLSSIAWIDPATRTCPRIFGGARSDWDLSGPRHVHTHQFEVQADGALLVFDNDGAGGNRSRALEYALDDETGTSEAIWDYTPDPPRFSFALGDVHRLDDGSTFVAFSLAGELDRVAPDGEVLFQASTPMGTAFGYVTHTSSVAGIAAP